jgi:hypothetical protein
LSNYYKSNYYNRYNKQHVNDDNNGKRYSRRITFNSNSSSSNIPNYSGLSYGLAFFFDRRQHHYEVINDLIFSQIINLKNSYDKSNLFDFLRLNELGDLNGIVYEDAKIHLEKHRRYLPQKIVEIQQDIPKHNLEVDELDKKINDFIHCNYLSFPSNPIFTYHFIIHIKTQSLKIWFDSIKNIKDRANIVDVRSLA